MVMSKDNQAAIVADTQRLADVSEQSRAGLPHADLKDGADLIVRWGDANFSFWNAVLMPSAANTAISAERSLYAGREFMLRQSKNGSLLAPLSRLELAADGRPVHHFLSSAGLREVGRMSAMVGRVSQIMPVRTCPLIFRRVQTVDDLQIFSDINCEAHGMPADWGTMGIVAAPNRWMIDFYSVLGLVGSEPVSTASVLPLNGSLYVGLVATRPSMQRRGFADATVRYALQKASIVSGIDAADLHATVAGRRTYTRLGYTPGVEFVALTLLRS